MRHIRLVTISDDYDSTPGFIIKGTPNFKGIMADRGGMLIAHDLLEHVNGPRHMGPVWDELQAIGAGWQVRGQHGDLCNIDRRIGSAYTISQNFASDVTRMFEGWMLEGCIAPRRTKPHLYDDDFLEILGHARRGIPKEFTDPAPDPAEVETYLRYALDHMRVGFNKARKRWGGPHSSQFYGHSLFCAVRDAVAEAGRDIEFEGQEFRLSYGNGEARCAPIGYDYDE